MYYLAEAKTCCDIGATSLVPKEPLYVRTQNIKVYEAITEQVL